jgi:hypothetical protein
MEFSILACSSKAFSLDLSIQFISANTFNNVTVSNNEPLAINRNCTNSFFEYLPFPSAIFMETEVAQASICSSKRKCFLSEELFSMVVITSVANATAFCQTFKIFKCKIGFHIWLKAISYEPSAFNVEVFDFYYCFAHKCLFVKFLLRSFELRRTRSILRQDFGGRSVYFLLRSIELRRSSI